LLLGTFPSAPAQVIETTLLSLEEFASRTQSAVQLRRRAGHHKDVVASMQSVYWFHKLQRQSGLSLTTLQRRVEAHRRRGVAQTNGKWAHYPRGSHSPNRLLLDSADDLFPGSIQAFDHALWSVLRLTESALEQAPGWCVQLPKPMREAVLDCLATTRLNPRSRFRIESVLDLNSLACLTLLFRIDVEQGRPGAAKTWIVPIARALLACGSDLIEYGVAEPLGNYYEKVIFRLAEFESGHSYSWCGVTFVESTVLLACLLEMIKRGRKTNQPDDELLVSVLGGDFGLDAIAGLLPIKVSSVGDLRADQPLIEQLDKPDFWVFAKLWALHCLRNPKAAQGKYFPTEGVYRGQGEWAWLRTMCTGDGALSFEYLIH
jgi:hypothetical protein